MEPTRLLNQAICALKEAGLESPDADARTLLAHVCQVDLGQLLLVDQVSDDQVARFNQLVADRSAGIPIQHLTGVAYFRFTSLEVGPGVFIPRPETEIVAGWAIDKLAQLAGAGVAKPIVFDLCTGSGAIAKSIATECSFSQVYAVEKSAAAFDYAKRNLADTSAQVSLGDFADLADSFDAKVDLVISNPPYLPETIFDDLPIDVKDHDPKTALVSGLNGLDAITSLVDVAARLLKPGGWVVIEHGDDQAAAVVELFESSGVFSCVADHLDLTNRPRFVTAVKSRS